VTASTATRLRVHLYDAEGRDREIDLADVRTRRLGRRNLLWVDADRDNPSDIVAAAAALDLEPRLTRLLETPGRASDLTKYEGHLHLVLVTMEPSGDGPDGADPVVRTIDVVGGRDWVLTVRDGPVAALERLDAATEGETRLGDLDAAGFVAAVADEVLMGYLKLVEDIERDIDRLDERALMARRGDDILSDIVALRRRIGRIRRALAPQRVAFAALARPEMALDDGFGRPWPGLTDRLDRTTDAVASLRDLLLGTYEIHMGRAAQDANDIMKLLTLVSAVFLPAVVLAGVMGMNFQLSFFEAPDHFWVVIAVMLGMAVAIVLFAARRRWV